MIAFIDSDLIRDVFFLAVRVVAALGGFVVGYFLTGPVVSLLYWLIFRKSMPQWSLAWCKVLGGVLMALLVFRLVPDGGKGSDGGTRDGKGSGQGTGKNADQTAKHLGTGAAKGPEDNGLLVIHMLGPKTTPPAADDRGYVINQQQQPVNLQAVKEYLQENHKRIKGMQIVFTGQSVSREDPIWVVPLLDLAREHGLNPPDKIGDEKK